MTELDRLRRLLELVRAMRHAQREYFKSRHAGLPAHNELKAARERIGEEWVKNAINEALKTLEAP